METDPTSKVTRAGLKDRELCPVALSPGAT